MTGAFHVHVEVNPQSLSKLKNVIKQFIKYEKVFDELVPPSRRDNDYAQSYLMERTLSRVTKMYRQIDRCYDENEIIELLQPNGNRYFKLNLRPLLRQVIAHQIVKSYISLYHCSQR